MSDTSPNIALVLKHLAGFEDIETYIDTIGDTVTEDLVWFNSGFPTHHGIERAKLALKGFGQKFKGIRIDTLNIAEDGDKVWTERIDYQINKDGSVAFDLPCMGIFEIENGKIKSWRDYFDGEMFK
jgi:limonene-1,2-epoxide hydrolase